MLQSLSKISPFHGCLNRAENKNYSRSDFLQSIGLVRIQHLDTFRATNVMCFLGYVFIGNIVFNLLKCKLNYFDKCDVQLKAIHSK